MQYSISVVRDLALLLEQSGLHEISFSTQSESETPLKIVVRAAPKRARRFAPPTVEEAVSGESSVAIEVQKTAIDEAIEILDGTFHSFSPVSIPVLATAVGLFSLAPAIEIGTRVKKNQVVAYVESMKIPTEVRAPQNGTVHEVFAESGQGVEWGQSLLSIIAES